MSPSSSSSSSRLPSDASSSSGDGDGDGDPGGDGDGDPPPPDETTCASAAQSLTSAGCRFAPIIGNPSSETFMLPSRSPDKIPAPAQQTMACGWYRSAAAAITGKTSDSMFSSLNPSVTGMLIVWCLPVPSPMSDSPPDPGKKPSP